MKRESASRMRVGFIMLVGAGKVEKLKLTLNWVKVSIEVAAAQGG